MLLFFHTLYNPRRILSIIIALIPLMGISFHDVSARCYTDGGGAQVCDDTPNILGQSTSDLRQGNITLDDIPTMIVSVIEFLLGIVGSICVVALIYHAVRMQIASGITGDSSGIDKAKKGIYGSLLGFILSMSAWFIMTKLVALLAATTGG